MTKKITLTPADREAFDKLIEGVQPLKQKNEKITPPRTIPVPKIQHFEELEYDLREIEGLPDVTRESVLAHKKDGISNKILRKLRKGQYNIEANLDLHGMSVENAKLAVEQFLKQCIHQNIRVALIVHGKGIHSDQPVLKNKLNHWLRAIPDVLAFSSAAQVHGSRGAVYVLLKRSK